MTVARSLRAVRALRQSRGDAASRSDIAYTVYAGVLLALLVAVPLVRALAVWLAEPTALAALTDRGAQIAGLTFGVALAVFVALGGVRGPALLSPFLTSALAGNGHPRSRTLVQPVVRAAAGFAVGGAGLALLPALVLATGGRTTVGTALVLAGAGALAGVAFCGAWLLGQRVSGPVRVGIIALVSGITLLWLVISSAADVIPVALLGALAGLVAALAACSPLLLNGLRGPDLLAQAQRWQTAGTLAFTGDLAMALGEFRSVPRRGRSLAAIGRGSLPVVFLRRDAVGALRTPARFAAACVGCVATGFVIASAVGSSGAGVWLLASSAGLLGYLAIGVWADGFRHAVEASAAPSLYGVSSTRLFVLHAVFPSAVGVVLMLLGAGIAVARGAPTIALAVATITALLIVLVRLYDSGKGPLPLSLLAPIPTPAGDMSALVIAVWQADAVIVAGTTVVALALAVVAWSWPGLLVCVLLGPALVLITRRRLSVR